MPHQPLDLSQVAAQLVGCRVASPKTRTLSGHAAGGVFEDEVYGKLMEAFPGQAFRQFEYLNKLYAANPHVVTTAARHSLIPSKAVAVLINRGSSGTKNWTPDKLFTEKQNDTADVLIVRQQAFDLIDVKTSDVAKKSQPPNIISAVKLARMCATMIDHRDFSSFDITYIGVDWELQADKLCCKAASARRLFKVPPQSLYINWAAATQIQLHVAAFDQSFRGDVQAWTKEYLKFFVHSAEERIAKMQTRIVAPYRKYLKKL